MTFQRDLWSVSFPAHFSRQFPCPQCSTGIVTFPKGSFDQYPHSDRINAVSDSRNRRFTLGVSCNGCGQFVVAYGDISKTSPVPTLIPRGFYPPLPIITIPPKTPRKVARELNLAFSLFWVDLGSCANKLRISVERILDEFKIPPGRLDGRITAFQKVDPDHAATFDALRRVGNVGSHAGDNTRTTILDAFEVFQHVLDQLFGGHKAYIDSLRSKIVARRGR
jgi:hypothetical protein